MGAFERVATVIGLLVLVAPAPVSAQARGPVVRAPTPVTVDPAPVRAHSSPQIGRNPRTGELVVAEAGIQGARRAPSTSRPTRAAAGSR